MRSISIATVVVLASTLCACGGDDDPIGDDLCAASDETPIAILGKGVGSAFIPYEDNEEVGLVVASQGGFGVSVLVRTTGLEAGPNLRADVQLNVEDSGTIVGDFLQENTGFSCRGSDIGGEIRGVVVGFDPQVYSSNDDLLELDESTVELVVTVTDEQRNEASVRQPVVIRVGG